MIIDVIEVQACMTFLLVSLFAGALGFMLGAVWMASKGVE